MPAVLKIKSGFSRFFDQEQVSLPPLGQRYGNNPTVSQSHGSNDFQQRREEWRCGGRTHPFIFLPVLVSHQTSSFCLCVSFFSAHCFQRGVLSFKSCVKLSCFSHFPPDKLLQESQKMDPASGWEIFFVCLWVLEAFWFGFGFFKTKRIIKRCTCTQQWSFASSCQVLAIVTLAMVSASIHSSTASSTLSGLSSDFQLHNPFFPLFSS